MTVRDILKMGDPRLLRIAQPVPASSTPTELHLLIATCSTPCAPSTAPAWPRRRSAWTCNW
jgi:hypothetical protein